MPSVDLPELPPRERTDESLRVERDASDRVAAELLAAVDNTADAVIGKARARADQLLAAARIANDGVTSPSILSRQLLEQQRKAADQLVRDERAHADVILTEQRAALSALDSLERDDTDKDLESERAYADDTLATRDESLGIVSHDLRSMLQVLLGHAELIRVARTQGDPANQITHHLATIAQAGARMDRLIGDLVDVASIGAGCLPLAVEVLEPDELVSETVDAFRPLALASEIDLAVVLGMAPRPAVFDPARILQVLSNLLSNAIKFTPRGGKVVVRVLPIDGALRFSVSDTGIGIAADMLDAVFDRFFQVRKRARPGVGLGLYISKCIVLRHGGQIWAESTLQQGSTFSFTVPLFNRDGARPG